MITIGAGPKNLSTYLKNSFRILKAMTSPNHLSQSNKISCARKYAFIHAHTKFLLYSFIRSRDEADLLLDDFFSKMPLFQKKNAIFINKSKSVISLQLIKQQSWNLVCIFTKYLLFNPSNFFALTRAVQQWHDFGDS